jgi:chaperonin GroEL
MHNAGEESAVIVGLLSTVPRTSSHGYDAQKDEYVGIIKAVIIVPLEVVRIALVDMSGVASLLTTSGACVVDVSEEDKPAPGSGMGGGMG